MPLDTSFSVGGGVSVGTLVAHVIADIRGFTTGLSSATVHLKGFSTKMDTYLKNNVTAMRRLGRQATLVGGAVVAGIGVMIKSYGEFERRMRRATAISDVSGAQFVEMSRMAEVESKRLNISATAAADAFFYLGQAGLTATQQMEAFPAVAVMSKAAVIDMDQAAEMLMSTVFAWRRSFKETSIIADILTEATVSSLMSVANLAESMELVGAVAKRTNNTIAETAAIIGLMADVGIKGSIAGTSLRRALLNLAAPSSEVREELQKWGLTVYDTEGKMKPLIRIISEWGDALKDATEEQKNMAFKALFGIRAITGQIAIFELGSEAIQAYIDRLNAAGGTTEKIAKKQMVAFMEQVGKVGKEIMTLARHIGKSLAPAVANLASKLGPIIADMTEWIDTHREATTAITATVAAIGVMVLVSGTLTLGLASLTIAAAGLGVSVVALGAAVSVTTLGIGALAGSVVYVVMKLVNFRKEVELLKKEMKFDEPIAKLGELINKLAPLVAAQTEGASAAFMLLSRNLVQLKILEEDMGKALDATKSELLEMAEKYKLQKPGMLMLVEALRSAILKELVTLRDTYTEMARQNAEAVERMLKRTTVAMITEVQRQKTIYQVAAEWRKAERTREFETWKMETSAYLGEWTEMEYMRIKSTREAIDSMHDSTINFFTETLVDARNWRDHIVNFLNDIARAISRSFATRIVEQVEGNKIFQAVASAIGGMIFPGAGAKAPIPGPISPEMMPYPAGKYQYGGIVRRPQLATIGEVPEAIVPLSGGRSIPVETVGKVPQIDIHVHNEGTEKLEVSKVQEYLVSDRRIIDVTMRAMQTSTQYGRNIALAARRG